MIAGLFYFLTIFLVTMALLPGIGSAVARRSGVVRAIANGKGIVAGILLLTGLAQAIRIGLLYARNTSHGQAFGARWSDLRTLASYHVLLILLCLTACFILIRRLVTKSRATVKATCLWALAASIACGITFYITIPRQGDEGIVLYFFLAPLLLLAILLLLLASLTALVIGWRYNWYSSAASSQPLCPSCDYNLTGNVSGICPECSMPLDNQMRNKVGLPSIEATPSSPRRHVSPRTVGKLLVYLAVFKIMVNFLNPFILGRLPVVGPFLALPFLALRRWFTEPVAHIILPPPSWRYLADPSCGHFIESIALWSAGIFSSVLLVITGILLSRSHRSAWFFGLCWCTLSITLGAVHLMSTPLGRTGIPSIDASEILAVVFVLCRVAWELGIPLLVLAYLIRTRATGDSYPR